MTSIPVMRRDHYDADNDGTVDAAPLSDSTPTALGTANAGTGSEAARSDHVHAMPNRARGAYDAIVYIQDGDVIAEDATGDEIDSGDAGTDDAIVLQATIDWPATWADGSRIVIKRGNYYIDRTITLRPKRTIIGEDYRYTIINLTANSNCDMFATPTSSNNSYIHMENLRLDGNKTNNATGGYGIKLFQTYYSLFRRVTIANCKKSNIYLSAGSGQKCDVNHFDGCFFTDSDDYGMEFQSYNYGAVVDKCTIIYNLNGIYIRDMMEGFFSNNAIWGNLRTGIIANYVTDTSFIGNLIEDHYRDGVSIGGSAGYLSRISFVGNKFKRNSKSTSPAYNYDALKLAYVTTSPIIGNTFDNNSDRYCAHSINELATCENNMIIGNSIHPLEGMVLLGTGTIIRDNQGYKTSASGTSTGTGSEQTIAHALVAAPSKVVIVPTETGASVSPPWADSTNIYCTVTTGKAFNWSAEV